MGQGMDLPALGDDAQEVVFEVPEAANPALNKVRFAVEALGDAVVTGEAPHTDDFLKPVG